MFKKVLISEDIDSIGMTLKLMLEKLKIEEVHQVSHCDEAFLKIKKAILEQQPYDLLICDLSFKDSHINTTLFTGEELINTVKTIQPDIKIVVYSIEDKSYRIKYLFEKSGINAYILKGRNSIPTLQKAIQDIYLNHEVVIPIEIEQKLNDRNLIEIDDYDISILQLMSKGYTLEEISTYFKTNTINPSSSSSIEKKITKLKSYFKANNNVQLIALSKDLGII
ncbi:response regulator [Flavobacterium faecale]|uniref:response regulator n=1 Tax=Flavobacterium faecale TaxID=1355330 RepID=UPI003AAF00F0